MNKDFPRIITMLRKEKNLSQKQAANELGISQALLSHYEKGIRECGLEFLSKAADYYEVSTDYLLGRTSDRIAVVDEPEQNDMSPHKKLSAPEIVSKRLICNSISVVYDHLIKAGSRKLSGTVSSYLMMTVYDIFRILYSANPDNPEKLFSVSERTYSLYMAPILHNRRADIKALAGSSRNEGAGTLRTLECSEKTLSEEYPALASSLLNIIAQSESVFTKLHK